MADNRIRPAEEKDAEALAALSERNILPPWRARAVIEALRSQSTIVLLAEETGQAPALIAYLIAYTAGGEAELESIAVEKTRRRQGAGHALLSALFATLKERQADCIFLEVRETNAAAKAFYEAHGFVRTGTRKGFYADTGEDAAVYRKDLFHA